MSLGQTARVGNVDPTADELKLLREGLLQWLGPGAPTDALAAAMGFKDVDDLLTESNPIRASLERGQSQRERHSPRVDSDRDRL
jgi:hypothetical protein